MRPPAVLERERAFAAEILAPPLAPLQQGRLALFRLDEVADRSFYATLLLLHEAADQPVLALDQLGERQLDVRGEPVNLRGPLSLDLLEEGLECLVAHPASSRGG